jgi:hypothetical protein
MVMKSLVVRVLVAAIAVNLFLSFPQAAHAMNTKTSFCKSMLQDIKTIDATGVKIFNQYTKDYSVARKSGTIDENLTQTRSLLELYENDRTLFLRALESKKCFTATEILNLEGSLANAEADAISVKSWLDVLIGIPGKKFYSSYLELPKYLAKPIAWNFCEKKGVKYKTLTCKTHEGKLRWVDSSYTPSETSTPGWPTDFIEGKVNLIEAKKRIRKYFEENSVVAGTNGAASVDFMKRTSYPGLFNFEAEPKLTACKDFAALQDKAGSFKIKYVLSEDNIKPDPDWVISDGSQGSLIVNQKFQGQVFSVPVRIEISQGDWSDPGTFAYRHVALIDGIVYRFSAC